MLEYILHIDTQLFLFLNGLHCAFIDPIMVFVSGHYAWTPLYVGIIFFLFWKRSWKIGVLALLAILLTFALTDFLSVHLFKNTIQRLRPCHEPNLTIHLLEGCGGKYGFISSHAANVFGLAAFTALFFRKKYYTFGILFWASLVSYSRIYVGKHYPLDLLCGAAFGILIGWLVYLLYQKISEKISKNKSTNALNL